MSATEFMKPSMPAPPPPPRTGRTTFWIVLAVLGALAVLALGVILAVGALFVTSSSEESSTGGAAVGPVTSVQLAPVDQSTPAPTVADTPAAPASQAELLAAFGDSWQSSDWERMQTLSNETVVGVAKEWYVEGGKVEGIDTCSAATGSCEFLYAPPDQTALIFTAQVETVEGRLVVSELSFGGDAG